MQSLSFALPEQFQERGNFGAVTDVYALAATLYVLLTNELPIPALFRQHADLKSPQEFNSNICDRLLVLCFKTKYSIDYSCLKFLLFKV